MRLLYNYNNNNNSYNSYNNIYKFHQVNLQSDDMLLIDNNEKIAKKIDSLGSQMMKDERLDGSRGEDPLDGFSSGLDPDEVDALLEQFMKENLDRRDESPARFAYLYRRLRTTLLFLLRHLGAELAQSRFVPVEFELPISKEKGAAPLEFTSKDGVRILLEGTVDRVDVFTKPEDGKEYLRVVDYKSGRKQFDLNDLLAGLEMQMPIYLFTLCREEEPIPAGVLYMPARAETVEADRKDDPEKIKADFEGKMRMNGLLLMDYQVLEAMETDLTGKFIPVKKTSSGISAQSKKNTVTPEEWKILREYVVGKSKAMADQLHHGGINDVPLLSKDGRLACEYCEYQAVCGHENDSVKRRETPGLPRDEVLKQMQVEYKDEE